MLCFGFQQILEEIFDFCLLTYAFQLIRAFLFPEKMSHLTSLAPFSFDVGLLCLCYAYCNNFDPQLRLGIQRDQRSWPCWIDCLHERVSRHGGMKRQSCDIGMTCYACDPRLEANAKKKSSWKCLNWGDSSTFRNGRDQILLNRDGKCLVVSCFSTVEKVLPVVHVKTLHPTSHSRLTHHTSFDCRTLVCCLN